MFPSSCLSCGSKHPATALGSRNDVSLPTHVSSWTRAGGEALQNGSLVENRRACTIECLLDDDSSYGNRRRLYLGVAVLDGPASIQSSVVFGEEAVVNNGLSDSLAIGNIYLRQGTKGKILADSGRTMTGLTVRRKT